MVDLNQNLLSQYTIYDKDGNLFIKKDTPKKVFESYLELRSGLEFSKKFRILHRLSKCFPVAPGYGNIYYVPEDIFDYVRYKDHKIIPKKTVPEKLKEKFDLCAMILQTDFNYYTEVEPHNFRNGQELGLPETKDKNILAFMIQKSKVTRPNDTKETMIASVYFPAYRSKFWEFIGDLFSITKISTDKISRDYYYPILADHIFLKQSGFGKITDDIFVPEKYWYPEQENNH